MGTLHHRWRTGLTRREALLGLAGLLAGSPLLHAQPDPRPILGHRRFPGLDEMMSAFDFEPICYANIPLADYDYTAHGTDSEFTMRRNREAFDWVELVERPGVSPDAVNISTEILGIKMDVPIMVAPTARQGDLHPEGDAAMYQGATTGGAPMIVASGPSVPLERIAAAATGPRWQQLYATRDQANNRKRVEQFQALGARALVVTVDQQASRYERDLHDRHLGRNRPRPAGGGGGAQQAPAPTKGPALYRVNPNRLWYNWKAYDEIRTFFKGPTLVKGILTAEDAKMSVEHGYHGIIVSNHGGRSIDYGPSTLEVLPEIVDAVGGRVPVIIDSGFRRGSDIVKALALGANAVCLGRPPRWALAAFGPAGVDRLLTILKAEIREAMAKAGRASLAALDRTAVRTDFP